MLAALTEPVQIDEHQLPSRRASASSSAASTTPPRPRLLKAADVTLYWAKSDGRNRWARFDPERNARDMTGAPSLLAAASAWRARGVRVLYQPIVGLDDRNMRGVEALVRWATRARPARARPVHQPGRGDRCHRAAGPRVLIEACERAAECNLEHPDAELFVSVNLAVRQASGPGPGRRRGRDPAEDRAAAPAAASWS